jgi:Flp pilus assembly protein TadG
VEFAISVPVLFTLMFGFMMIAFAVYTLHTVSEAAHDAARWASVRGSSCSANTPNQTDCNATQAEIQSYIQGLEYPGIDPSNLTVTATWLSPSSTTPTTWTACASESGCNGPSDAVQVVVSYHFPLTIPFLPSNSRTLSGTAQMVIQQ